MSVAFSLMNDTCQFIKSALITYMMMRNPDE